MRRIVKKQQDTPETTDVKKQWKFYTALEFMKKDIEEDLKEKVEMTDEEKSTLEFVRSLLLKFIKIHLSYAILVSENIEIFLKKVPNKDDI